MEIETRPRVNKLNMNVDSQLKQNCRATKLN